MVKITKPRLSFWQIWNMNVGFFGIQFSFGLQQTAVSPIFSFLGAHHDELPLLNLAGPVTGLLIQPIIGAISDKTWSPKWGGRRKPFFLIGAILASLCLFAFPFSPELWFAVGLLWILDAGNNTAMEPYRAFVGDKLPDEQLTFGYQMQSLFVGAGITLANLSLFMFQHWFSAPTEEGGLFGSATESANAIPTWVYYSFFLGALASIGTVMWSVWKTPEIPPSPEELAEIKKHNEGTPSPIIQILSVLLVIFSAPLLLGYLTAELFPSLWNNINLWVIVVLVYAFFWLFILYRVIKKNKSNRTISRLGDTLDPLMEAAEAIGAMPGFLWKLAAVYLFQWYALFVYWQFMPPMLRKSLFGITNEDNERFESIMTSFREGAEISSQDMAFAENVQSLAEQALGHAGLMNGTYNFVTMIVALALVPMAAKIGSKLVYVVCLFLTGIAMLSMPYITDKWMLLAPMVLFGIGWAAMMGIPYAMVSKVIPEERRGVYMGLVNMMIVIPMLIQTVSFGPLIKNVLDNDAINAIIFGGVFFIIAGLLAMRLNLPKDKKDTELHIEVPAE
ncbi:MFS transporter [Flagellimonas lutaonensis]|uniref:Sugar transporter n=1 Tax=Flagellimonas lutaonensis TaxID=516051 RepID=A0A0D5YUM3_9FLAO|nr:MFS transporter [Allomuricauda lutaonensis]AKA35543.1 Sugar transporter [Allomuricauda lutaonensis]